MFYFSVLLFLAYLLRLWLSSFYGVHPEEAYYWTWSQDLAWGYFENSPLIAWCIRLGTFIVNSFTTAEQFELAAPFYTQIGLRIVPYFLSSFLTPLVLAFTVVSLQRSPLRVSQMLVILSSPVFLMGPLVVTPDTPLFAGWALALFFAIKFQRSRAPDSLPGDSTPFQLSRAIRMGMILAFCLYSKYSGFFALILFLITGSGLYNGLIAGLLAFVLYLPHLAWIRSSGFFENTHFLTQLQSTLANPSGTLNWQRAGDLVFSQFALWTPLVFLGLFLLPLANFKKLFLPQRESRLLGTLFLWAFIPLLFFTLTSMKTPIKANWPLIGIIPALALIVSRYQNSSLWLYTILLVNFSTLFVAIVIFTRNATLAPTVRAYSASIANRLEEPSRLQEFQNWDNFHEIVAAETRTQKMPVAVESYQVLSALLFHDLVARADKKIGSDRLKIFPESPEKSQFQFNPKYRLDSKDYWLVSRSSERAPLSCKLYQTLFKSPTELDSYLIYRCSM
jgi:hypothetical protein